MKNDSVFIEKAVAWRLSRKMANDMQAKRK